VHLALHTPFKQLGTLDGRFRRLTAATATLRKWRLVPLTARRIGNTTGHKLGTVRGSVGVLSANVVADR
jgi:hypothetical protein